jgi:hypothetical protein
LPDAVIHPAHTTNPFSTRFTRPGAIEYLFPPGIDAALLLGRLAASGWWGQIVGPHGSGKSTLLATLRLHWEASGREPLEIPLRDGQRQLPRGALTGKQLRPTTQVIIDGYEQLSWTARYRLKRLCRLRGCGLLVTSHLPVGLPELFIARVDLATTSKLVEILAKRFSSATPLPPLEALLAAHGNNVRELLFGLYDWYEQHRL